VRKKLTLYHAYQDNVLTQWLRNGKKWERPRLRVVFLTRSIERAYHILALANELNKNRNRRLVYAASQDCYIAEQDRLQAPIFLNHFGGWQSLVELHPTALNSKTPVRLTRVVESPFV
jgi:hypothetical protein